MPNVFHDDDDDDDDERKNMIIIQMSSDCTGHHIRTNNLGHDLLNSLRNISNSCLHFESV